MEKKKELFLAVALLASAVTSAAFADSAQDSNLLSSTQTYQLVPGTQTYGAWASWIADKLNTDPNISDYANGAPVKLHFATPTDDVITVTVVVPPPSERHASPNVAASPDGAPSGPPTPLPASGTPGERITVTDQTHTYYATWTYEWMIGGGGGEGYGWGMINSHVTSCDQTDKPESVMCQPLP